MAVLLPIRPWLAGFPAQTMDVCAGCPCHPALRHLATVQAKKRTPTNFSKNRTPTNFSVRKSECPFLTGCRNSYFHGEPGLQQWLGGFWLIVNIFSRFPESHSRLARICWGTFQGRAMKLTEASFIDPDGVSLSNNQSTFASRARSSFDTTSVNFHPPLLVLTSCRS